MIKYKFKEELAFAKHYAEKLQDNKALAILESGDVRNKEEAIYLSDYFWRMVDASIEDEKNGVDLPWDENAEFWTEKLMNSISGYLERTGYEDQWDNDHINPRD